MHPERRMQEDQVYAFNDRARALVNEKKLMKPEWFTTEFIVLAKDFVAFVDEVKQFSPLLISIVHYVAGLILQLSETSPIETDRVYEVKEIMNFVRSVFYKSEK